MPEPTATDQERVLNRLNEELKANGPPGGRAWLKAIKEKLGAAATQGEWLETFREMEKRINNYRNGI